jgi:hypothetical protein
VGKGENAGYQHFSPFSHVFKILTQKLGIVWYKVKTTVDQILVFPANTGLLRIKRTKTKNFRPFQRLCTELSKHI